MQKIIFLYRIFNGLKYYYYTNSDMNVVYNGEKYISVPISHDNISSDIDEVSKSTLKITLSNQLDYVQHLLQYYDNFITTVTVYRYYLATKETSVDWTGSLTKLEISDSDTKLTIGNVLYETQRQGLRQVYQRLCPYALYGCQCKVNKDDFVHQYSKSNFVHIDDYNLQYTGDALAENILGGMISLDNGSYYFIKKVDYTEKTITTSRPIYKDKDLDNTTYLIIYEGCDRSMDTCNKHFNNSENYGGFVLLPLDNPTKINHS